MGGRYRAGEIKLPSGLSSREAVARAEPLLARIVPTGERVKLVAEPLSATNKPNVGIPRWSVSYVNAEGEELANVLLDGRTGRTLYVCRARDAGPFAGSRPDKQEASNRARKWMQFQDPAGPDDPWTARHISKLGDRWIVRLERNSQAARVDIDTANGQVWLASATS
jgi:hypothetical protein